MTGPLSLRRKLLYVVVIDVVVLLLLEGGARLLVPGESSRFDTYEKLSIAIGIPGLNQALRPDPELFWALKPNLPPTLIEGRIGPSDHVRFTMSTGPEGLRTVPGSPGSPTGTILAVGDSCTFGLGVNDDETFPARLSALTGRRVVNAAVPGYTAYQGRLLLEKTLARERPGSVILTFGWNDGTVWDGKSDLEHGERAASPPFVLRLRLAQLLFALLPDREAQPAEKPTRPRLLKGEFRAEVAAMIALARKASAKPVLVAWPAKPHLLGQRLLPHHDALRELARDESVTLLDLFSVFPARGGERLYVDIVHASPEGCRVVAESLVPLLR